jgi:hypothetical protein
MTTPADEQAQSGPGDFLDIVDVQLLDESLLVAARITRAPSAGSATATAVVVADGEPVLEIEQAAEAAVESWEHTVAGPLELRVAQPLERWSLSLDAPGARLSLELRALTPPADLAEPATAAAGRAAGVSRYTQLCRAQGSAEIAGRRRPVDALSLRTHRWGALGQAGRTRFLTAATDEGTLLTLAAVRPAGAAAHGEELVGGQSARAGEDGDSTPLPYETVRLSTVFGDAGLPVKAGAELFRPGDELPSRLAGVAAAGVTTELTGGRASLTLFRFRLDGVPSFGAYEIEAGA